MEESKRQILWADDEIDLLRPHRRFLNEKGYEVTPVNNGKDAIELIGQRPFDIVLLDEMMPGLDGLSTLEQIKEIDPNVPVIMITKNEEEHLMNEAIGRRIDDYLTKPVNPSQIFMACKKILDSRQIRQSQAGQNYVSQAGKIREKISGDVDWKTWIDVHRQLCEWDIEVGRLGDAGLQQMVGDQRRECNHEFGRFVERNYASWVAEEADSPPLSVDVVPEYVMPYIEAGRQVFFVVVDCLRLDHWMVMEPQLAELFNIKRSYHYSILPTATPFSRNAIFSGLFPSEIAAKYPKLWGNVEYNENSLNRHEHRFIDDQVADMGVELKPGSHYVKVLDTNEAQSLTRKVPSLGKWPLVSVVYNFLDMLVHGRAQSELLKEMAPDELAFRDLVKSWFSHSSLFETLKAVSRTNAVVVLTTDHGAVRCNRAAMVHGDRDTSSNLRYKYGRNLRCEKRDALMIEKPETYGLPNTGLGSNFIVAKEDSYFVYPTNFNEYQRQYKDSFQHGGISLEEMVLPVAILEPK
ncbi:MAG: T9SS response regulator signal transducer PorX [Candidatus Latescibacterota bacterium]|jgi:CheY-like chemotaxis protein